jgi:hypothetical protein
MVEGILELFKPSGEGARDVMRFLIFFFSSFFGIWMVELWLCRSWRPAGKDTELNIYFSWLALFTFYGGGETIFSVALLNYYIDNRLPPIHVFPYLVVGLLSLGIAWHLNRKISHRISELE